MLPQELRRTASGREIRAYTEDEDGREALDVPEGMRSENRRAQNRTSAYMMWAATSERPPKVVPAKPFHNLYDHCIGPTCTERECVACVTKNQLSTGEPIDFVLVYNLPHSDYDEILLKQAHKRPNEVGEREEE